MSKFNLPKSVKHTVGIIYEMKDVCVAWYCIFTDLKKYTLQNMPALVECSWQQECQKLNKFKGSRVLLRHCVHVCKPCMRILSHISRISMCVCERTHLLLVIGKSRYRPRPKPNIRFIIATETETCKLLIKKINSHLDKILALENIYNHKKVTFLRGSIQGCQVPKFGNTQRQNEDSPFSL